MDVGLSLHPEFSIKGQLMTVDRLRTWITTNEHEEATFSGKIARFIKDWLSDGPMIAMHSSGSTGKPKIIHHSKTSMIHSARNTCRYFGLNSGTNALLCLPVEYVAGKMMVVRAMVGGWNLEWTEPSLEPLKSISKDSRFDFAAMTPVQVSKSLEMIDCIRCLIIGGAPVSEQLERSLSSIEIEAFETYGMTETITHIAVRKLGAKSNSNEKIFELLPNIQIEKDSRDCLEIRASYLDERYIVTNDVVEIIEDRSFKLLGRVDDVINSGGVKLFPEQIEGRLKVLISEDFMVFGLPDEYLGESLCLLIETKLPDEERTTALLKEIEGHATLSKLEKPKRIFYLSSFIRTETGKIKRKATIESLMTQNLEEI